MCMLDTIRAKRDEVRRCVARGLREFGNANATVCGGSHFIAYYSGHFPVTDVYVHRVRGD